MKKIILLSIFSISVLCYQSISAQSPTIMYSLPATELCIEIEIEKTTEIPGDFYRYSERYLATSDVVTTEKTTYSLKNLVVKTRSVPDKKRTYSVVPGNKSKLTNITVNSQGILCGMNVPATEDGNDFVQHNLKNKSSEPKKTLLPLNEEYMMASSSAKMAEGAAKQIYFIRESRFNLITGDVDNLPSDGESFKIMLQEMDKTEKELTELFTGKRIVETETQTIYLLPSSASNEVLFRFSAISGLVAADDLSGSPYYINVTPQPVVLPANTKQTASESLLTVIPATTQISITDGKETLFSTQMQMPQLGSVVAIPDAAIKNSNTKVSVDDQTGRLISIE